VQTCRQVWQAIERCVIASFRIAENMSAAGGGSVGTPIIPRRISLRPTISPSKTRRSSKNFRNSGRRKRRNTMFCTWVTGVGTRRGPHAPGRRKKPFPAIARSRAYRHGVCNVPKGRAKGLLAASGGVFGGWSLFLKDRKLHYSHNYLNSTNTSCPPPIWCLPESTRSACTLSPRKNRSSPTSLRAT
jgi:hypothetical protein